MQDLIRGELAAVLDNWEAGKPVRAIALGHQTRLVTTEGIQQHEHHVFRQLKAYDYAFRLIKTVLLGSDRDWPANHEDFLYKTQDVGGNLTLEEREAGASLAWKAVRRGWRFAITGFPTDHYMEITRDQDSTEKQMGFTPAVAQ